MLTHERQVLGHLFLAAHRSDGSVGDLAGEHPVPVLVVDGREFPVNLTN